MKPLHRQIQNYYQNNLCDFCIINKLTSVCHLRNMAAAYANRNAESNMPSNAGASAVSVNKIYSLL